MSLSKINSALCKAFVDSALVPAAHIQQENAKFEPPSSQLWAAMHFLPGNVDVATLGAGGSDRVEGIFQIDLNTPADKGTKQSFDTADALRNTFTAGKRLTYSGQEVVISNCGRSQGRNVNGFYRVSVTVVFYAHVNRT